MEDQVSPKEKWEAEAAEAKRAELEAHRTRVSPALRAEALCAFAVRDFEAALAVYNSHIWDAHRASDIAGLRRVLDFIKSRNKERLLEAGARVLDLLPDQSEGESA